MSGEFCPRCGTPRTASFRFCRRCQFDYDTLGEQGGPAPVPEPTPEAIAAAPPVPASAGSRRGWVALGVVIFVAIVAAAAFIGLSSSGALAPRHSVTGTFTLQDTDAEFPSITTSGSTCRGTGGYGDVSPGQPVTLRDGDGKILGATTLGSGVGSVSRCVFSFGLDNIREAPFYSIEVGRRGEISYSLADMKAKGWEIGLVLGE